MATRNYNNTAQPTSLTANASSGATSLTVASTAGYPPVPFTVGIDRGTADEEVVLVTAVTSTTMTVTRGYDGTAGVAHLSGAAVEHCVCALDYSQANEHINDDGRDDHGQYLNVARAKVYFPETIDGTGAAAIATVTTSYQQFNTVTIASEPFARKAQIHSVVSFLANAGAFYRARISRAGGAFGAAYFLNPGTCYVTLHMMSDWLTIAADTSYTFTAQIKRDSGSGGNVDDDPNFNKISALIVPNI